MSQNLMIAETDTVPATPPKIARTLTLCLALLAACLALPSLAAAQRADDSYKGPAPPSNFGTQLGNQPPPRPAPRGGGAPEPRGDTGARAQPWRPAGVCGRRSARHRAQRNHCADSHCHS